VDTIAVIESFIQLIPKPITGGETVKLVDFGSFCVDLKSELTDREDDFISSLIDNFKIYFRPGKELKKALRDTTFAKEQ
jgi:nucleoid DNA-binding protein